MNRKENFIRAITRKDPEWIPYCWEGSFENVLPTFIEMPEQRGYDDWGSFWEYSTVTGAYPSNKHNINKVEEILDFKAPDPYVPGLLDAAKSRIDGINKEETFVVCNNHLGMHERSYILMGMEDYLIELIENEEYITMLYDKIIDFKIKFSLRMIDELDIDGIWLGDDWGTETSLFFSPDLWRKNIKPRMKNLYDEIHNRGKFVFQHSCGKIEQIIPDLVEIGLDVWNPCQPCNDLAGLKKRFGDKLTFMGGVDSVILDTMGKDEIEEEIKLRIEQMSQGGGYVLEPSHHVQFPKENIEHFIACAIKYGRIKNQKL